MTQGIWTYNQINRRLDPKYQISLDEGHTPLEDFVFENQKIKIKREDHNPNRSFKDRSLAYQISYLKSQNTISAVISSSGNAAASAIAYCSLAHISLQVFVSDKIPGYKFDTLINTQAKYDPAKIYTTITKSPRAKSDAFRLAKQHNIPNLRGSTDPAAIVGFETIAYELVERDPSIDAIFVCCSSGTSTLGIYNGYKLLLQNQIIAKIPQIHIVQSSKIHPIAGQFDHNFDPSETSLANAISDRIAHRKTEITNIIEQTHASAWVVDDTRLSNVKQKAEVDGLNLPGFNAYVSVAGFQKAIENGYKFQNPVCIVSGI